MWLQPAIIVASYQGSVFHLLYHLKTDGQTQKLRNDKFNWTQQKWLPILWDLLTVGCCTMYQASPSTQCSNVSIANCEGPTLWRQHVFYIVLFHIVWVCSGAGVCWLMSKGKECVSQCKRSDHVLEHSYFVLVKGSVLRSRKKKKNNLREKFKTGAVTLGPIGFTRLIWTEVNTVTLTQPSRDLLDKVLAG